MKWYTIPSVLICGLNSMLAAIILCLAAFHLYTDKSTNAPILPNEQWICLVTCLLPFSVVWMSVSVAGIFISMSRRRMVLASLIISLYTVIFGGSIYFTVSFGNQLGIEDVSAESLYNVTLVLISRQQVEAWIPGWLENIQKQSKQCCGVITYRDYEDFWPNTPTKIPRSCCRDSKELPSTCPGDLTQIPFPNTPANYIKVETGCMDEINEAARHHIKESYQNSIVMNIFIGMAVFSFLILYVKRYLAGDSDDIQKREKFTPTIEADSNVELQVQSGEGPIIVASSQQITATSLDSMGGSPQVILSFDNLSPEVTDQQPPQNYYYNKEKEPPKEKELPYVTLSRPQPSMSKINKANAVFAGLQQQQQQQRPTEASTGDDMTIGGGNIGRQEIYLAQDSTERPIPEQGRRNIPEKQAQPTQQQQQQRPLQATNSGDDVGDVVPSDQEPTSGSPPGSPTGTGGRRKKVRKLGLAHHKNEHHHHHSKE